MNLGTRYVIIPCSRRREEGKMAVAALASVRVVKSSWDTQRSLTPNHTQPSLNNKNPSTVRLTPSQNKQITPTTTPTTLKKNFNVSELLDLKNRDSTEDTEFSDSYLGYERWLPDPPAVKKPRSIYNAASLAYIGDCIYELYARRHFLFPPLNIEEYNDRVTAVVRCEAQDALLKKLRKDDYLSEKERDVLRWGKNIGSGKTRTTKRAGVSVYNRASSLETLVGYLYLTNVKRLEEVMQKLGFSTGDSAQLILKETQNKVVIYVEMVHHNPIDATIMTIFTSLLLLNLACGHQMPAVTEMTEFAEVEVAKVVSKGEQSGAGFFIKECSEWLHSLGACGPLTPALVDLILHLRIRMDASEHLNYQGSYVKYPRSGAYSIVSSTISLAEAWSAWKAHNLVRNVNNDHIFIEGDSKLVINCLDNKTKPPWRLKTIVEECRTHSCFDGDLEYQYEFREANKAADWLANQAYVSPVSFESLPRALLILSCLDYWGRATRLPHVV